MIAAKLAGPLFGRTKSESNRFVYEPGELQTYDPDDKSELTETGEDETEDDPFQMTDEELEDKLKEL